MARTDAIVLGSGIVGASIALHLVKRGMSVALIDRAGVGEQTSYGNAGIIEGNTVFPLAFPAASAPDRLAETARLIRPLFARAVAEHEALMAEADATQYLRKNGWLK